MALITISGYPSSGKSTRAKQIQDFLNEKISSSSYQGPQLYVHVLSDDTLNLTRSVYSDSGSEKSARAALYTAMQRELAFNKILIVDSLNSIKGFRYQMYCAAREMNLRVCTVYTIATPDLCRDWNANRQDGRSYEPETLESLIARYEEPSSMVRWDSPLFVIPWTETDIPSDAIWNAITQGLIKPPNSGTLSVTKAPADALHVLEQTTTTIISSIFSAITTSQNLGDPLTITLTEGEKITVTLPPRNITLSELQRCKRHFVTIHKKVVTLGTTEKGRVEWGEESISRKFSTYLEEHLKP